MKKGINTKFFVSLLGTVAVVLLVSCCDLEYLNGPSGFPRPDEFVVIDQMPIRIYSPMPEYPEMARRAGIEGAVWVGVLVDVTGNVRNAIIVKESGTNAGFEESALKAAWASKWKPAIQNDQPVAVWVTYKIIFRIA